MYDEHRQQRGEEEGDIDHRPRGFQRDGTVQGHFGRMHRPARYEIAES